MVHNALGFLVYYKVQNGRKSPRVRRISDSRFGLGFIYISTVVCIFSSFREVSKAFSSWYLVPHIARNKKKHEVIKFYSEYGFISLQRCSEYLVLPGIEDQNLVTS